jgi:hypothetical protein
MQWYSGGSDVAVDVFSFPLPAFSFLVFFFVMDWDITNRRIAVQACLGIE